LHAFGSLDLLTDGALGNASVQFLLS